MTGGRLGSFGGLSGGPRGQGGGQECLWGPMLFKRSASGITGGLLGSFGGLSGGPRGQGEGEGVPLGTHAGPTVGSSASLVSLWEPE